MARYIAKNVVASGRYKNCTVQLSYAIGIKDPTSLYIYADGEVRPALTKQIQDKIDLTPKGIIDRFNLFDLDLTKTTNYGHFGKNDMPWEETNLWK